jgi:ATP-dependent DNA helicase DinG
MIGLSATVAIGGNFAHILADSGLDSQTKVIEIESPFNYQRQGRLNLPQLKCFPNDNDERFIVETSDWLNGDLSKHKSSLVLFSSWRGLNRTLEKIYTEGVEILVQGSDSKARLIQRHIENIDQGRRSAIFATQGFYEGVDLTGEYLTNVVITKIPFDSPADPTAQTLNEFYKMKGLNTFLEVTLPHAQTKMIQACGRLIRTDNDFGVVSILDNRLTSKSYGKLIIDTLPDFKIAN